MLRRRLAARNMERGPNAHFSALFLRIEQIWSTIATTIQKLEAVLVVMVIVPLERKGVARASVRPVKAVLLIPPPVTGFVTFVR